MPKRTPKNLKGAIKNGAKEIRFTLTDEHIDTIEAHVRDFIAQMFATAMINEWSVEELWEQLKGKLDGHGN
jgi:hypothetical protein